MRQQIEIEMNMKFNLEEIIKCNISRSVENNIMYVNYIYITMQRFGVCRVVFFSLLRCCHIQKNVAKI